MCFYLDVKIFLKVAFLCFLEHGKQPHYRGWIEGGDLRQYHHLDDTTTITITTKASLLSTDELRADCPFFKADNWALN